MKKILGKALSGFIVGFALMLGIVSVGSLSAAQITPFSGPLAPSNLLSYLNQLVGQINTTLAPGGSGRMAQFLSISTTGIGQVVAAASWTSATSTCGNPTGATRCLGLVDENGTLRWIGAK